MQKDNPADKPENLSASLPITPLQRKGHTDHMVATIMSMIEKGVLKEGDMLPPERELAQQFNVGRNTLREAIKILEIYGVVDRARRLGTVIRRSNLDHILGMAFAGMQITPEVFEDIQGFRVLIETGLASVVAERIQPSDITALKALVSRMESTSDITEQANWDYEFHLALVKLAGNAVIERTYRVMAEPMKRLMELGKGTYGTQASIEQHEQIVAALAARDIEKYTAVLRAHMTYGRQYISDSSSS